MKRYRAKWLIFSLLILVLQHVPFAFAEERAAAESSGDAPLGSIIELLKEKRIITNDEAASFIRQMVYKSLAREDLKALVDLLRQKGVVSGEEAAGLIQGVAQTPVSGEKGEAATETASGVMPKIEKLASLSEDQEFIDSLKEKWVKSGNKADDFESIFPDPKDAEEIIDRMKVMGVFSPDEAEDLDREYRRRYLSGAVTTVMENKEKDYLERIRKNVSWEINEKIRNALKSSWVDKVHLYGDIRLRYEGDFFDKNNADLLQPSNPTQIMNTKIDRNRFRVRLRLGVEADVAPGLVLGAELATGTTGNPSQTVTFGDSLNDKPVVISKAFLKWRPFTEFSLWGGRFENPWFYTDLVWYPDLNFDGIVAQYKPQLSPNLSLFFTGGLFPLQEVELSARDKWLFGGQMGFQYRHEKDLTAKLGVAYYYFQHTVGIVNNPAQPGLTDWTAPQFQQKGNTLMDIDPSSNIKTAYASEFKELNITGSLDIGFWHPTHFILIGDYVNNLGFKQADVNARTGTKDKKETEGYQLGAIVGNPVIHDFGDWKGSIFYKYLESDAVMDAYADQDFHLGGTNAKGWIIGGDFGLSKNVWLSTRWFTANEISGPP
ncbi:MAG TPA: putative porin, partial [Geobacteraceae bacterium]